VRESSETCRAPPAPGVISVRLVPPAEATDMTAANAMAAAEPMAAAKAVAPAAMAAAMTTSAVAASAHVDQRIISPIEIGARHLGHRRFCRTDSQYCA
jgi:hypothetical protein